MLVGGESLGIPLTICHLEDGLEPIGNGLVRTEDPDDSQSIHDMWHDMEDRTFDATLAVNNPGARAKPIHRPPVPLLDDLAVQDRAAMMPMAVQRLRDALHIRGDGIDAIAKLLQVHPLLPDDYVRSGVAIDDDSSGRFWVTACESLDDDVTRSPLSWLKRPDAPTFDPLVWTVNPQAVIEPIDPSEVPESDAAVAWRFHIDSHASPPELP